MASSDYMPIGPGFLLFFQNYTTSNPEKPKIDHDRIKRDDDELLEILTMVLSCNGTDRLY